MASLGEGEVGGGWTGPSGGCVSPVPLPTQEVEKVDAAREEDPRDPQDPGQVGPQHGGWTGSREPCAQTDIPVRWPVAQVPPFPQNPLLIRPTWVCAEGQVPTGLLGALREGSELAAKGGAGTGAPPCGGSPFQGEGDAGASFPAGSAGGCPVLGAECGVQHGQRGPPSTIGAPVAHSHQGDGARAQESTADGEGGLVGLPLNLQPHLRSPCGRRCRDEVQAWVSTRTPGLCSSAAPTHRQ